MLWRRQQRNGLSMLGIPFPAEPDVFPWDPQHPVDEQTLEQCRAEAHASISYVVLPRNVLTLLKAD